MEGSEKRTGITDRKFKRLLRLYGIASAVFVIILTAGVFAREYAMSFDETSRNLERIRLGLVRTERATRDMKQSITDVERVIPLKVFAETPERQLLAGLDELKNTMKIAVVRITDISLKENRMILPISIKGLITDYSIFVNDIGKLQAMRFPFVSIQNIVIKREEVGQDKASDGQKKAYRLVYEITGELTTLSGDTSAAPEQPDNAPLLRRSLRGGS